MTSTATVQGDLWGRSPDVWAARMEPKLSAFFSATLDAVSPLRDVRLLDAGCGAGLALRMAADRGARVSGIDAAERLIEIARTRTPDAEIQVGAIEELPYEDGTFDVVTAFNSIQYTQDPAATVAELARVTRSGGSVAIGSWGYPAQCESDSLLARLRSLAPPPPGTPAPLGVAEPGVIEDLLEKAGLIVARQGEVPVSISFATHEDAFVTHTSAGPVRKVLELAGEDAVRAAIKDVLESDRKPDGLLRQDNVFRFVVGVKP